MSEIKVRYSSVDGYSKSRKFKSLKAASKFARERVGDHPEIGSHYAVSGDGIGKIVVEGAKLAELFPSPEQVARSAKLELIWKRCHNDYKGKIDGVRTIMTYRNGTCLVGLDDLTDAEIADKLPKAEHRKELEQ
jgi:hypothetical protein